MADKQRDDEWKKLLADTAAKVAAEVAREILIEVGPIVAEEAGTQGRRFAERLRERRGDVTRAAQAAGVRVSKRLKALPGLSRVGSEGGESTVDPATGLDELFERLNERLDTIEAKVDELRKDRRGSPNG